MNLKTVFCIAQLMIYSPYFNSDTDKNKNFIMQNFRCNLYQNSKILEILVRKFTTNNKIYTFQIFEKLYENNSLEMM